MLCWRKCTLKNEEKISTVVLQKLPWKSTTIVLQAGEVENAVNQLVGTGVFAQMHWLAWYCLLFWCLVFGVLCFLCFAVFGLVFLMFCSTWWSARSLNNNSENLQEGTLLCQVKIFATMSGKKSSTFVFFILHKPVCIICFNQVPHQKALLLQQRLPTMLFNKQKVNRRYYPINKK